MYRIYIEFAKKSFQKRMQYRVANLAGLTTNFFFATVRIFVFQAFYSSQSEPMPLDLQEVITYICLTQAFLMVIPLWGRSEMAESIKDGSVALHLVKPVDFHWYWFADECGKSVYYILMRAIPTFVLAKILFDMSIPTNPATIGLFLLSMTLTVALGAALNITTFATVFWTLDATGISGFMFTLTTFFSGFLVPIALWPEWLQQIASWLPFEGFAHLPFSIYLGQYTGWHALGVLGRQFAWVIAFLLLGRLILQRGFARLVIQGG